MLNVDKYREAIMNKNVDMDELDCHIAALRGIKDCGICECSTCMRASFKWIFSEYEPPLLENGDDLKPGDWIMVRDCEAQSFVKRQFLYFYGHRFYCARKNLTPLDNQTEWYMQARLPMEGE